MSESNEPVRLVPSQKGQAVEVLMSAFLDDAGYIYVFPDVDERTRSMRRLWHALIGYCLVYGEVYTTRAITGIACWLPPGKTEANLWRLLRTGMALPRAVLSFKGESRRRMTSIMSYNDDVHSHVLPRPHWYLGALAVNPLHQGQGIGSSLLRPVLIRADARGEPCYLETQTEDNVHFYEKHGFVVVHEGEVPGHGLKMWAMVRQPIRG